MCRIVYPFALANPKLTSLLLRDHLRHVESRTTTPGDEPEPQIEGTRPPAISTPGVADRRQLRNSTEPHCTHAAPPARHPSEQLVPG